MTVAPNTINLDTKPVESSNYYTQTAPYIYPTYPTYTYTVQGEDARLRLALELIADAESLAEAKRIAAKALRIEDAE